MPASPLLFHQALNPQLFQLGASQGSLELMDRPSGLLQDKDLPVVQEALSQADPQREPGKHRQDPSQNNN